MKIEWAFKQLPAHFKEVVKHGLATEGTIMFFASLKIGEEKAILNLDSTKLSDIEFKDRFKSHQLLITHYTQLIYFLTTLKEETTHAHIHIQR